MAAGKIVTEHITRRTARIWKWTVIVYAIALHIFAAVLIAKTDFIPRMKSKLGFVAESPQSLHFQGMLTFHRLMDETVPDNSVVFLGDGHVQALAVTAVSPDAVNFGIGGQSTAQLLEAIPSYKSLRRASAIVLEIGISDIVHGKQAGLQQRYQRIVASLPRETTLIWNAVMPIRHKPWMKMNPSDIAEANRIINSLCESRGKCIFVDTWKFLGDNNGKINQKYYLEGGEYLSDDGYKEWVRSLRKAVAQAGL
jgi:lysophospholipase L1-like esterase